MGRTWTGSRARGCGRARRHPGSRACSLLGAAGAVLWSAVARPVAGQIVNTLRGWEEPEPGWSGELETRFALSSGNADYLELSAGGAAQIVAGRHRVRALASETLRRASGEKVAEDFLVHARHNYALSAAFKTLLFAQNQVNPFRRLARRTLFGVGGRWDFVRAEAWDASLGASYMLELERLTDDPGGGTRTEHRASYFLTAIGRVTETLRVDVSAFFQPLLDDYGDSRAYASASGRVDVVGGLDLLVALELLHDSDPPAGVEATDLTLSSGLVLEF